MGEEKMPSSLHPLLPMVGERAGPRDTRVEELALHLSSYNTQESQPCTLPGNTQELTLLLGV